MPKIRIAGKSDIPEGQMRGFTVGDKQVLVANVAGNHYAVDAICTHMHGYLPAGKLDNSIVTCPVHGARYDVTNGKLYKNISVMFKVATRAKASDLNSYPLTVDGDDLYIEV